MNAHGCRRPHSRPRLLTLLTLGLLVGSASLLGVTAASEQAATAAVSASLRTSPNVYVGGQRLTWTGNVGSRGERRLVLQLNMGRDPHHWITVPRFHSRTHADGSFRFTHPAPSMFNVRYRVKAGKHVTPARVFNARSQDLTLRISGQPENNTNRPGMVGVGQSFGIAVNTVPETIYRSPDSKGLPVFEGRTLTLQRRNGDASWSTVDTTTVAGDGTGHFAGLQESAGIAVYRVRQENYFTGENKIGWTQSFPLYVLAGPDAQQSYRSRYGLNEPTSSEPRPTTRVSVPMTTASQQYSWFPSRFDFAWEYGESLSRPPARGTRIQGRWVDYSDGSGRVAKWNGGLGIESKRYAGAGAGDFGTTRATMQGNAMTYGRWETSLRFRNAFERGGNPYRVLAELVPASEPDYDCGFHNITIAHISPFSRQIRFGARSRRFQWNGATTGDYTPLAHAYNVAVEVTAKHVTWFVNGDPVGSVASTAAISGLPMTMRLSLEGHGESEMDQLSLISDWQRGFPVNTGRRVVSPKKLSRANAADTSCAG